MLVMLIPFTLAAAIPLIILTITSSMTMKMKLMKKDREQASPFECGFTPTSSARIPFSMHYFLIALLFLIFDMEIVILMPMPITMATLPMSEWALPFMSFLVIVTAGWLHEWNEGSLEWTK